MVNHQRNKLTSVYFHHSGYADHHIEQMYRTIEKHTNSSKESIQIVGAGFNGPRRRSGTSQCWSAHIQRGKQKRRLGEAMADDTQLHSTQHGVQKNVWKANDLQIA